MMSEVSVFLGARSNVSGERHQVSDWADIVGLHAGKVGELLYR